MAASDPRHIWLLERTDGKVRFTHIHTHTQNTVQVLMTTVLSRISSSQPNNRDMGIKNKSCEERKLF